MRSVKTSQSRKKRKIFISSHTHTSLRPLCKTVSIILSSFFLARYAAETAGLAGSPLTFASIRALRRRTVRVSMQNRRQRLWRP